MLFFSSFAATNEGNPVHAACFGGGHIGAALDFISPNKRIPLVTGVCVYTAQRTGRQILQWTMYIGILRCGH